MARGRYITPDSIPTATICRVLTIPDETIIRAAVTGALSELIYASNWEQVGAVTAEDMAAAMLSMFEAYAVSGCDMTPTQVAIYYHEHALNVAGGSYTGPNVDNRVPFNTNIISQSWLTLANNIFTIQPGRYLLEMYHVMNLSTGQMWPFVKNEAGYPVYEIHGMQVQPAVDRVLNLTAALNTDAVFQFGFWMRSNNNSVPTNGFGVPKNLTPYLERYGVATFTRLGEF